MQITITLSQLLLLVALGVVIALVLFMLQTLKKLRETLGNAMRLISGNEASLARIRSCLETIAANAEEINRIAAERKDLHCRTAAAPKQNVLGSIEELRDAFNELVRTVRTLRKMTR